MNRNLLSLALLLSFGTGLVTAQDGQRPPPPADENSAPRLRMLPRGAEQTLKLTDEQRKKLADLENETRAKIETILTPAQVEQFNALRPAARGEQPNRDQRAPAPAPTTNNSPSERGREAATEAPARTLPPGVSRVPVVFSGGHETVPVDHGRPVVLIAAALGVPDEVFREAFSHVRPAGPGSGGPTDAEARTNKAALMNALGKLGVTNDRLNTVSNFYRYASWQGGIWRNKSATGNALVKDGAIIGYEVTSGGYGYTVPPTVSVPGVEGAIAKVEISYGKDFETNGAVSAIAISQLK